MQNKLDWSKVQLRAYADALTSPSNVIHTFLCKLFDHFKTFYFPSLLRFLSCCRPLVNRIKLIICQIKTRVWNVKCAAVICRVGSATLTIEPVTVRITNNPWTKYSLFFVLFFFGRQIKWKSNRNLYYNGFEFRYKFFVIVLKWFVDLSRRNRFSVVQQSFCCFCAISIFYLFSIFAVTIE